MALTRSDYTDIVGAFQNAPDDEPPPSYRSVARALGHSARTIRGVYESGWNGLPSVAELLEQKRQRERFKRLQQAERVGNALRGLHARLLSRVGTALAEVPVALEPIRDTKSARQAVLALRELADLSHDLYDERGDDTGGVHVNVNIAAGVNVDERYCGKSAAHVATMKSVEGMMARYPQCFTPEHEQQTVEVLGRAWLEAHPERDSDTDETIEQRRVLLEMFPTAPTDPAVRAALRSALRVEDEEED